MLEDVLRLLGFGLCHQLPERSFFGGGVQVPVCSRDTGIYVGFVVALAVLWALERGRRSSELPPLWTSLILAAFIVVMGVDGVSSYAGLRGTTNEIRLLTGLMTGYALAAFTLPLLNSQLWVRPGSGKVLSRASDAAVFFVSMAGAFAVTYWVAPFVGVAYPVLVALAILVTFSAVNGVIVALLPPFERKARRAWDTWPVFAIGLAITFAELAGAIWLKAWLVALSGVGL